MKLAGLILALCLSAHAQILSPILYGGTGGGGGGGGKAFVQACTPANQTTTAATITVTCTGVGVGHSLIVTGALSSGITSVACTDSVSSSYSTGVIDSGSAASAKAFECHAIALGGSGSITVTVTPSANVTGSVFVTEASGITAVDVAATFLDQAANTTWTFPGATTTSSGDFVIGFGGNQLSNATYTAGAGYTIPANSQISGGGQSAMSEYQVVAGAATYTPTSAVSVSIAGSLGTVAFK